MNRIVQHLLLAGAILAGLALAWELRAAILVILISAAAAAGMQGPIDALRNRRVPHALSVLGVFLLTVGLLAGLIAWAMPSVLADLERLAGDARDHYARHAEESPASPLIGWVEGTGEAEEALPGGAVILSAAWVGASGVLLAGTYLALILVIAFYWLFDRARFERLWLSLLAARNRPDARETWRAMEREVGAYVRSEVIQGVLAGVLLGLGFWLLGHPYPALAALLGAVAWSIPWVGTLLTMGLIGAMGVVGQPPDAGLFGWQVYSPMLHALGVLLFLEGVVERKIFDRGRYNSLLIVLVTIALAELYGIGWILLGPPAAVVIQIIAARLWRPEAAPVRRAPESVADRVHALEAAMSEAPEVPADLANLVARLSSLVDTHHLAEREAAAARPMPYSGA